MHTPDSWGTSWGGAGVNHGVWGISWALSGTGSPTTPVYGAPFLTLGVTIVDTITRQSTIVDTITRRSEIDEGA